MINPNMTRPKNRDGVTISHRSPPVMRRRASNHSVTRRLTIMNMNPMDNNVRNVLNRETSTISDVNIDATTIYGFEAVHDQLLFQGYDHIAFEDDPEWLILNHGVTECSRYRINRIVVSRVGNDVETTVAASDSVAAKSDGAIG